MKGLFTILLCVLVNTFGPGSTLTKLDEIHENYNNSAQFKPDLQTGLPRGDGSMNVFIFPGTKWCGEGNTASSYDDLGTDAKTDICCRAHDHCPYYLDRWDHKYNAFNKYPWTVSHCNCDIAFYECLKDAQTEVSKMVGEAFFGALTVDCFTFEDGRYCAEESWTHLHCEEYKKGPHAEIHHSNLTWSIESIIG